MIKRQSLFSPNSSAVIYPMIELVVEIMRYGMLCIVLICLTATIESDAVFVIVTSAAAMLFMTILSLMEVLFPATQ
jgi:hypothetical protein